mmetsp:Transcript_39786/g.44553  ORF Transcript_39786/g.44553 Transcript_39786/m.44553 type:complete len:403 (+) Transcript_39786:117-1325(+)
MLVVYFIILSLCVVATFSFHQTYHCTVGAGRKSAFIIRSLPLLFLSPTKNGSPDNIHTCVVLYDDGYDGEFLSDAKDVARTAGIPLFYTSNITQREKFTHALKLIPYDYCGEQSTFALSIEPMGNLLEEGSRRSKRRSKKPKKYSSSSAFFVDLCPIKNSRAGRRVSGASGTSDLLIKAVSPRKGASSGNGNRDGAIICDLTAGLGQDSMFLAMNGAHHVHMIERNPIVAALLQDAMRRLQLISSSSFTGSSKWSKSQQEHQTQKELACSLLKKLSLTIGEGVDILQKHHHRYDVIYLDPMFPSRQKQSAVKKGMQILHGLIETKNQSIEVDRRNSLQEEKEQEEQHLLLSALDTAKLRVVVKRPIKAALLGCDKIAKPSYSIAGSMNRWDIYVKPKLPSTL